MISVIIPTYNEEIALPITLEYLFRQPEKFEVIIVDGGSTDQTTELISTREDIVLVASQKGRAAQMNKGAAIARGEWLLFLHADTLLLEGALAQISDLDERIGVGGFRHRFFGQFKQ